MGVDPFVIGDILTNELLPTHPLYNIPPKCAWQAFVHFQNYHSTDECSDGEDDEIHEAGERSERDNDDMNGH